MRVGVIVLLLPALTGAQAPAGLDVVSVRPHASSSDESDLFSGGTRILPGRLIARRVSLEDLAALAHGIPSGIAPAARRLLIQGWPTAQMAEARFDVEATLRPADADLSLDEWRPFVLDILRSRFGLQTHTERRRVRAYALRLIEPGRLGPALRQRTEPCGDEPGDCRGGTERLPDGLRVTTHGDIASTIAFVLQLGRDGLVVDETGLRGDFDAVLTYDVPAIRGTRPQRYPDPQEALAEQLGLQLVATGAEVEVVVVDAVALPTPN